MALGKEEIEWIGLAGLEAKRIKIYRTIICRVNATKVDDELPVDKDPNVVIAPEFKHFPAVVDKFRV